MIHATAPSEIRFDLGAQSKALASWNLPSRAAMIGVGAAFALAGAFLLLDFPAIMVNRWVTVATFSLILLAGLLAIAYSFTLGGGATSLSVDQNGVTLGFDGGGARRYNWIAMKSPIVIEDYRQQLNSIPDCASKRTGIVWVSPGLRRSDLTQESVDAVMVSAKSSGLSVTKDHIVLPGVGHITRISVSQDGHRHPHN